jgi:hypothetical protein
MTASLLQEITASVIAIVAVAGAVFLAGFPVVMGHAATPTDVPQWLSLLIGAIIGAYYTRTASQNGARQAGVAAAQTAVDKANAAVK